MTVIRTYHYEKRLSQEWHIYTTAEQGYPSQEGDDSRAAEDLGGGVQVLMVALAVHLFQCDGVEGLESARVKALDGAELADERNQMAEDDVILGELPPVSATSTPFAMAYTQVRYVSLSSATGSPVSLC